MGGHPNHPTLGRDSRRDTMMHEQQQPPAAGGRQQVVVADVPLAKRVDAMIERTEAGIILDAASAALSLLTVFTYMAETTLSEYDARWIALRIVDQVCSVLFAAEWVFWLWLARRRWRYVLSWQSLLDAVTIVPIFLSLFIARTEPGFAAFEAMVRIFRVVRVFRVFRLGKRLKSEVQSRLLTLLFTLLAIIVIGAGVFFEIETRYGDRYPDLTIAQAIYWSVVTTTTIGYGDYTPSIAASQMTLLAMLLIAFTLLPYQTSMLVNALSETSVYRSARYSRAAHGRHVVVTGHLTAAACGLIVEELFHPDSGFSDYHLVLLNPNAPSDAMRRLLKTSRHAHRLLYLQGSCVSEDLERAQVGAAEALFILCDKSPADAHQEDLRNIMACLAIGAFIQRADKARCAGSLKSLHQHMQDLKRRVLSCAYKAKSSDGLPSICLQLVLPESKQHLHHLLDMYSRHGLLATAPHAAPAAPADSQQPLRPAPSQGAAQDDGTASCSDSPRDSLPLATVTLKTELLRKSADATAAGDAQPAMAAGAPAPPACLGSCWWQRFRRHVTCICTTELRYGLLAQCCLGCSGTLALVSNLVRSVDDGALSKEDFERLPEWAQEYLEGSSKEVYEVTAFPPHLHGQQVADVAQYLLAVHRAVLLATSGTSSAAATRAQQQQPGSGSTRTRSRGIQLATRTLDHTITQHTSVFVIASDARVVLDIMDGCPAEFAGWAASRGCDGDAPPQSPPLAKASDAAEFASKPQLARHSMSYIQPLSPRLAVRPLLGAAAGEQLSRVSRDGSCVVKQAAQLKPAAPASTDGSGSRAGLELSTAVRQPRSAAATPRPTADSPAGSRRGTAEWGAKGSSFRAAAAAALVGGSARQLLAAMPSVLGGSALGQEGGTSAASDRQRRHRGSFQLVNTRTFLEDGSMDEPLQPGVLLAGAGSTTCAAAAATSTAASRRLTAKCLLQQLYRLRDGSMSTAQCIEDMLCRDVPCEGHILICACQTPPAALTCLLRPLRSSSQAPGTRCPAVVVLNSLAPCVTSDWDDVARLDNVHYVEGSVFDMEALQRANAGGAAAAVVLMPWCQPGGPPGDADDAASAGMLDAAVIAAVRQLRSVNGSMKVYCELGQYQSLAYLDPLGSLLDGCLTDEAAMAAATPPFMCGAVLLPLVLDSLTCQAVYNRATPHILSQLLVSWHMHAQPGQQQQQLRAPKLQLAPLQRCPCETFGQLFEWLLLQHGQLCWGLHRQAVHDGRLLEYVYTSPHTGTPLRPSDMAIVLSAAQAE